MTFTKPDLTKNSYLYNGNKLDDFDMGLHDFNARQYEAALGRFVNYDPLAEFMPAISPYNFGFNSPINHNDPSGLMPPENWNLSSYQDYYRQPDGFYRGCIDFNPTCKFLSLTCSLSATNIFVFYIWGTIFVFRIKGLCLKF